MELLLSLLKAFAVGGAICAIGQILIDKTKLTPAKILVTFLLTGALLGAFGLYGKLTEFAGSGAAVPISGFGNVLISGVKKAIDEKGFIGIFTGGLTGASAGIAAAITFGFLFALIFKPKRK
ncbi:MAG: stage V sporulation protein AE [Clostridia bacterium]|nr:stage V sporulation protein AE [Clostridia bacterium]